MAILTNTFNVNLRSAVLLPSENKLLFTESTTICVQDLSDGSIQILGDGYLNLIGIIELTTDKIIVVDENASFSQFTIYLVDLSHADYTYAKVLIKGTGEPMQLAASDDELYYVNRTTGEFVAVNLKTRHSKLILSGLSSPAGLVFTIAGKKAYISESSAGRIVSYDFSSSIRKVERSGLHWPLYLSVNKQEILFTQRGAGNEVCALNTVTKKIRLLVPHTDAFGPFGAWIHKDLLIVSEVNKLLWYNLKYRPQVKLKMEDDHPFIGSFQRVQVDFGMSGLTFNDVDFKIPSDEAGGVLSFSKDDLSKDSEVMLLVGYEPGTHEIHLTNKTTHATLAVLKYEISDLWDDKDKSPSHWLTGQVIDFTTGYTWGGGPATPQNVDVWPQSGVRNICILTVDTTTARFPTGTAFDTIKDSWVNGAVGTTADADGKVRSAKAYYEEVSQGVFSLGLLSGQAQSVSLNSSWTDSFTTMPTPWPANSYAPINNTAFAQACISAAAALTDGGGNPLINFQQVQTLILVIRSVGGSASDNFFWPQAWGGNFTVPGGSANIRVLGMPDDWNPTRDSRTIYETLSHEIGHNLGYPDLYTNANPLYSADIQSRDVTNFDLMSREALLPHMSIGQKMEVGWVRPAWVMPLDFSRSTIPLDQTFTLLASELGTPPAGQYSAIEIRLADGWNYYFEYRASQPTEIGDQSLSASGASDSSNNVVLGTDMGSQAFTFPIARPQIIRLRKDAEGENSFFKAGENYKETDTSSMAISDFIMTVVSTDATTAKVRIQYGTNGRPDLYIRPWPGGDNWQSPDIEVRNARSIADPSTWYNVPWAGHANTVVAKYRNRGPITATNVTVDFYLKDFTISGAPEIYLGSDTHDVPPESSVPVVEFSASWLPPDEGHKCIIVRTPLYIDTSVNPNIVEITDSNNTAQSNYTRYIPAASSPARRVITDVSLNNPFDKRTEISVMPFIKGVFANFYRLYLEHTSLKLDPGETQKVQVMIESRYGDPAMSAIFDQYGRKFFYEDTVMGLVGYGLPPESLEHHPTLLGGVQFNVRTGHATKFVQFDQKEEELYGQIVTVDGSSIVTGKVLLTFHTNPDQIDNTIAVQLTNNGEFFLRAVKRYAEKFKSKQISAHYPGVPGLAPCDAPKDILLA